MFDRPPREDYVRTSIECLEFTLEPAVEYRDGDVFDVVVHDLERCASDLSSAVDPMKAADLVMSRIKKRWPDRAYFVEVWRTGKTGFAQIFQPFGVPRNC